MAAIPTVAAVAAVAGAAIFGRAAISTVAAPMSAAMATIAIRTATTSAAGAGEEAGLSFAVAADQGNPDQGEEQRDTEHNNAIHPQILQLLTGTVS
jgi:hypothetical protein